MKKKRLIDGYRNIFSNVPLNKWFLMILIGFVFLALGTSFLVQVGISNRIVEAGRFFTLGTFSYQTRGLFFITVGGILSVIGWFVFYGQIHRLYSNASGTKVTIDTLRDLRRKEALAKGPKVVAIGGGTGLPVALSAWKRTTSNITAVVTVADDGGSSGRLRNQLNMPPPGDIRNCLVALAETESLMKNLMQYRFNQDGDLNGHSFGNLFIAALSQVSGGFDVALTESSRILRVYGRVLPATPAAVTLLAHTSEGKTVFGESNIPLTGQRIEQVELSPPEPPATEEAVKAIRSAEIITIGPGSLYSSVLPVLLVPGIRDAIRNSKALKVFIANIATQSGETSGYSLEDHINAIEKHVGGNLFDVILVNDHVFPLPLVGAPFDLITTGYNKINEIPVMKKDLVDGSAPWRHNVERLALALKDLTR